MLTRFLDYYPFISFGVLLIMFIILTIHHTRIVKKLRKLLAEAMQQLKRTLIVAKDLASLNDTIIDQLEEDEAIISELLDQNKCSKTCAKKQKTKKKK